jgi:hypothetical protein
MSNQTSQNLFSNFWIFASGPILGQPPSAVLKGLPFLVLFINTKNSLYYPAFLLIIQNMLMVNGEVCLAQGKHLTV